MDTTGTPIGDQDWSREPADDLPIARNLIGREWVCNYPGGFVEVRSPGSGEIIGYTPCASRSAVGRAVEAAQRAASVMRSMSRVDRAQLLNRIAHEIETRREELALALAREHGKPHATEARGEIEFAISGLRAAAEQIKWLEGSTFFPPDNNKRGITFFRPRGVYGIIVPWNYPIAIPVVYYLAPGLAAGNSFVWIPAPSTSLVSSMLIESFVSAGMPEGAVNLVTGAGPVVGDELAGHAGIQALGFTGSTSVGRQVALRAAGKHVSLELGGNGPTIVFEDADVVVAAAKIALACFTNAGQVCTSTERILVHSRVHDVFLTALTNEARKVCLGDPLDPRTTMGPLHNRRTCRKVDEHVLDGISRGAQAHTGGAALSGFPTRLYFPPTVLSGVSPDSLLNTEETFGPVAPVLAFRDEEHLRDLISRSSYGLFGSLFTSSLKRAFRWAEELRVGTVHVNERSSYWDVNVPGGGASGSASGVGRIGMKHSILQMSDEVAMTVDLS